MARVTMLAMVSTTNNMAMAIRNTAKPGARGSHLILVTQGPDSRRIAVRSQPRQIVLRHQKTLHKNRPGGVV
jgi:hypothetical protein